MHLYKNGLDDIDSELKSKKKAKSDLLEIGNNISSGLLHEYNVCLSQYKT